MSSRWEEKGREKFDGEGIGGLERQGGALQRGPRWGWGVGPAERRLWAQGGIAPRRRRMAT
jgi:hypothetical protein